MEQRNFPYSMKKIPVPSNKLCNLFQFKIYCFLKLADIIHCNFNDFISFYLVFVYKNYFENGLWKVSPNIWLKIIFIILLFSKNVFASANIIYHQSLCPN